MALAQSLVMAGDFADILYSCTGDAQKILMNLRFIDSVDVEISGKDQINGLSHFSCKTVFDGKHSGIAVTFDNRVVGGLEIPAGYSCAVGKDPSGCDMGKGTFHTTVSYLQSALNPVLIGPGEGHEIFQIVDVISFENIVFDLCGIGCNHLIFPFLIQNGKQLIYHKNKWMSKSLKTVIEYIKALEFTN